MEDRYLGDGVYASFDGFHIWLAVNDHRNKVVALEPSIMAALIQYETDLVQHYRQEQTNTELDELLR